MLEAKTHDSFLAALTDGRRDECHALVQAELERATPVAELYELFRVALYAIGRLWETGQASVSVEHRATAIVEDLLMLVYPHALGRERVERTAIVSCAADEFHQLGGRIVADTLELRGWSVHFLGAAMPVSALVELVGRVKPDLVAISVSIEAHLPNACAAVEAVQAYDSRPLLVVGGRAIAEAGADAFARYPAVRCLRALADLEALVDAWPVRR